MTFDLSADEQLASCSTTHIAPKRCAKPKAVVARRGNIRPSRLIGESKELAEIRQYIRKIANSDITAMITGPTG